MKTVLLLSLLAFGPSMAYAQPTCDSRNSQKLQPTSCADSDAVFNGALEAAKTVLSDKVNQWAVTGNSDYVTNYCDGLEVWPIHFGQLGNGGITVYVTVKNCNQFSAEE